MRSRLSLSVLVATAALVWLNAYWCREVFFLDHFGQMQSIRGFWEGLARLGHFSWRPEWWPYSYNGMPFEYAYAPGVPATIAAICGITGWSTGRAFGVLAGFVFCFGPVALFWAATEITRRPWWSFVAALVYSLTAPSQLLVPDQEFRWANFGDSRRILLIFAWDEVPHQLALACTLIAVLFLVRALRGSRVSFWIAAVFVALAMFVSAFGATLAALFLGLLWLSWRKERLWKSAFAMVGCGALGYLVICPFYPPSLIRVIQRNANLSTAYGWTAQTPLALLAVAGGILIILLISRTWTLWYLRFFLLLAFVTFAIPFLDRWNLHFVPQTWRYKVELEVGFALVATFAIATLLDRAHLFWRVALAGILLFPAALVVKSHRVYAKAILRPSDIRKTIEYEVANWLAANAPAERVLAPGSIGFWMNDFTEQQQFEGGSFTTIPTFTMQIPDWGVQNLNPSDPHRDVAKLWLQAYGVDALVVPGPQSPEPWKKFHEPAQFESLFPLLWRRQDTSIYSVPRTYRSLASVVPENRIVHHKLNSFFQVDQIRSYDAAMDEPGSQARWEWVDNNTGIATANIPHGSVLSLHITYHSGWKAFVDNSPRPVSADALEQLVVDPNCNGPCQVKLTYSGSAEAILTRCIAGLAIILAISGAGLAIRALPFPLRITEKLPHFFP